MLCFVHFSVVWRAGCSFIWFDLKPEQDLLSAGLVCSTCYHDGIIAFSVNNFILHRQGLQCLPFPGPASVAVPCHLSCSEKLGLICKCTEFLEAKHSWPLALHQSWNDLSGLANSVTRQLYWGTLLRESRQTAHLLMQLCWFTFGASYELVQWWWCDHAKLVLLYCHCKSLVLFLVLIIYVWVVFDYYKAQWGSMFCLPL